MEYTAVIRTMHKSTATAILLLQLFVSGEVLIAASHDVAVRSCPHHSTSRECTMDHCPMRTQHLPDKHGSQIACPTTQDLFMLSTQNMHEGAIVFTHVVEITRLFDVMGVSSRYSDHKAPPPVPPPC